MNKFAKQRFASGLTYLDALLGLMLTMELLVIIYLWIGIGLRLTGQSAHEEPSFDILLAAEYDLRLYASRIDVPYWVSDPKVISGPDHVEIPYVDGSENARLLFNWTDETIIIQLLGTDSDFQSSWEVGNGQFELSASSEPMTLLCNFDENLPGLQEPLQWRVSLGETAGWGEE